MVAYPRVYVSATTHERVRKLAAKKGVAMNVIGNKIVIAGLKTLKEAEDKKQS